MLLEDTKNKLIDHFNDTIESQNTIDNSLLFEEVQLAICLESNTYIFNNFNHIELILKKISLSNKKIVNIIFRIIENNIKKGIFYNSINPINIKTNNIIMYKEKSYYDSVKSIFVPNNELTFISSKGIIDEKEFKKAHLMIEKYYLLKANKHSMKDIQITIDNLKKIGINHEFCKIVETILENRIIEKNNKEFSIEINDKQKDCLSKKEHYLLLNKLNDYFDLEKNEIKKQLAMNDIIKVVFMLKILDIDKDKINKFIKKAEKQYNNPISKFVLMYNKLLYFEEMIGSELKNVRELLQEIFITNDEEYEILKELLTEQFIIIEDKLKNNYKYEHQESLLLRRQHEKK